MRILYNLIFIIYGIIYLPYLIITKRYKYGMLNRVGILPQNIKSISSKNKVIWIHAVSVGEMKTASILAPLLRKTFPDHKLLFSSVTHTGNKVARTIATDKEGVFYLPFDVNFITDKIVKLIKPSMFLCLETELWPNLIASLYKYNVKIILVNGRISNRSYLGYKKVKFIISHILSKFSLILMQSKDDKKRIINLGAPENRVFVTGNLKFDLSLLEGTSKSREIREKLDIDESEILLVGGSTHRGEEEILLDCFLELKKEYNNLKLLIAPRHIERTQEIEDFLCKKGIKSTRFSSVNDSDVCILDTIGELKTIYSASDIVFMGGSLVKKGGQNPIEPASFSKPVIIGEFTFNFHDVVKSFLEDEACIQVENKNELLFALRLLLKNPNERKKLGMNAKETVNKNSGSSQRTIDLILQS